MSRVAYAAARQAREQMGHGCPSADECESALDEIAGDHSHGWWDQHHPQRAFPIAVGHLRVAIGSIARLAAYRLIGRRPALGYYDDVLDRIMAAAEAIAASRREDYGGAPACLASGSEASSFLRRAVSERRPPEAD